MTETPAPDAAVEIAQQLHAAADNYQFAQLQPSMARTVADELDRLTAEVARLRAVEEAARLYLEADSLEPASAASRARRAALLAVLNAVPTGIPTKGKGVDLGDDPDGDIDGSDYPPFGSVPVAATPTYRPFGDIYGEPSERED